MEDVDNNDAFSDGEMADVNNDDTSSDAKIEVITNVADNHEGDDGRSEEDGSEVAFESPEPNLFLPQNDALYGSRDPRRKDLTPAAKAERDKRDKSFATKKKQAKARSIAGDVQMQNTGIHMEFRPMTEYPDMMDDMVDRVWKDHGLEGAIKQAKSYLIKVATMCSGTEAPLLALETLCNSFKARGYEVSVDHLFSAEIVGFKQAYIESNFHPRTLFRDIREVAKLSKARTAYGAIAPVPSGVHILIVGFSCVDSSNLNNDRKGLNEIGESGDTLRAVLHYAKRNRPKIILLENVKGNDWSMTKAYLENDWTHPAVAIDQLLDIWGDDKADSAYSAWGVKVDTKNFYLPQTRQRGYMVCIDRSVIGKQAADHMTLEWANVFGNVLPRPASSPLDEFLLPDDHPSVRRCRELGGLNHHGDKIKMTVSQWDACEDRYAEYRIKMGLGDLRPLLHWRECGPCAPPEYWWQQWSRIQTDRLKEHWEQSHLRKAARGYDSLYKTRIWDLSQNIDRSTDSALFGLAGCLTPHQIPFIPTRGGLAIGVELLRLQGLPAEKLLLGRLTESQIRDLVGNAMTTTVVGAAILALFTTCTGYLVEGLDPLTESRATNVVHDLHPYVDDSNLSQYEILDLASFASTPVRDLADMAHASIRLCYCESQDENAKAEIFQCLDCGHAICGKCKNSFVHRYGNVQDLRRSSPQQFATLIRNALPMRLYIEGHGVFDLFRRQLPVVAMAMSKDSEIVVEALEHALREEFRFRDVKRSHCWIVYFEGPSLSLRLILQDCKARWYLFAKPDKQLPGIARERQLFRYPIARMVLSPESHNLLDGHWELCIPVEHMFNVKIDGRRYNVVDSWQATLGLPVDMGESKVYESLDISTNAKVDTCEQAKLLAGTYQLLPKCETASASLHKKTRQESDDSQMYFFLDPDRNLHPESDRYVFAKTKHRLALGEVREVVASLDRQWKPTRPNGFQPCKAYGHWVSSDWTLKTVGGPHPVQYAMASTGKSFLESFSNSMKAAQNSTLIADCQSQYIAMISVMIPLSHWDSQSRIVGSTQQSTQALFRRFNWIFERLPIERLADGKWTTEEVSSDFSICQICSPSMPTIQWKIVKTVTKKGEHVRRICPFENEKEAGYYERALKAQSPAMQVEWETLKTGTATHGRLRVVVNWNSLAHRTIAKLVFKRGDSLRLRYRLVRRIDHLSDLTMPAFTLRSCRNWQQAAYSFGPSKPALRTEQSRTLRWMLFQEGSQKFGPYAEEALEEARLEDFGIQIMMSCLRYGKFLGGVLAQEVGFGKTAVILALIDATQGSTVLPNETYGKIATRATLILVPPTIVGQWRGQVDKFLGKENYKVVAIADVAQLARTTVQEIQEADIVIVNSRIFAADGYLRGIAALAGLPKQSNVTSRPFKAWYDRASGQIDLVIEQMKSTGLQGMARQLADTFVQTNADPALFRAVATKRLHGQDYVRDVLAKARLASSSDPTQAKLKADAEATASAKMAREEAERLQQRFDLSDDKTMSEMHFPILQLFHFHRIVVDEFTYVPEVGQILIAAIPAERRWVASGTPKLGDIMDVKQVADFMKINLGEDDDTPHVIKEYNIRKLRGQQTDAEQFRGLYQIRSMNFHLERHRVAQGFLDRFARQDKPEIGGMPVVSSILGVYITSAQLGLTLEDVQSIDQANMAIQTRRLAPSKLPNIKIDRLKTLSKDCDDPVEGLLANLCYCKPPELENTPWTCEAVASQRKKEYSVFIDRMAHQLQQGVFTDRRFQEALPELAAHSPWSMWIAHLLAGNDAPFELIPKLLGLLANITYDDDDENFFYTEDLKLDEAMLKEEKAKARKKKATAKQNEATDPIALRVKTLKAKRDLIVPQWNFHDYYSALERSVRACDRLMQEWVDRRRAIRFFSATGRCQHWLANGSTATASPNCSACGLRCEDPSSTRILSVCAHIICADCSNMSDKSYCQVESCEAEGTSTCCWSAARLGQNDASEYARYHGAKVGRVIQLIKDSIPQDEQVLLFVQCASVMTPIAKALSREGVSNYCLSKENKSKVPLFMEKFQEDRGGEARKVLILDATKDTAAGANLTNANHVIFLSTFWADNRHSYHQSITQCIGRSLRYGQQKTVHVYRIVALETVDVDLLEWREGKKLVRMANGTLDLIDEAACTPEQRVMTFSTGFLAENGYLDREE
ncbi:MAG: hypothetical protein Q9179_002557 [Wetmoreana sp. 5 TL-2023]